MDLKKHIGSKIREIRLKRGMEMDDLAERLGTTKQTVSRYELGDRQANQDILFQLSDIFNVSIDYFFPPKENTTNELERALKMTSDLKANEIEFLNQLLEKSLSKDEKEREKFFESIKFTVDYYENENKKKKD